MMPNKRFISIIFILIMASCNELQQVVNQIPTGNTGITNQDIALGLREALDKGIQLQVTKLAEPNGFYTNTLVRINLPPELQKVDKTLRGIGMGKLVDEGIKLLNNAAENAVSEAAPIFVNAVKNISFTDARTILMGNDNAATAYLSNNTRTQLYDKFKPIIQSSFEKVGADAIWKTLIDRYNALPLANDVNPDLTDYVTSQALDGVYTMIAIEEKDIRTKVAARTTEILRRIFALQD